MLNLIIGRENLDLDKVRMNSRLYFTRYKKPEWFETDFAKRVIKTVDKAADIHAIGIAPKGRVRKLNRKAEEDAISDCRLDVIFAYMPDDKIDT